MGASLAWRVFSFNEAIEVFLVNLKWNFTYEPLIIHRDSSEL
jgi:hypothetical protein